MKRFLSIILTVMLVLSSFVMVSADADFSVIKVDGSANYAFAEDYSGYYEISADIYVTQDVTKAEMSARNDSEVVDTVEITLTPNTWQTVLLTVADKTFDNVYFTAEGGAAYVKTIKVSKIQIKELAYEETFDQFYSAGDTVDYKNNTKLATNNSAMTGTINPLTTFAVVSGKAESNVATLYSPLYRHNWNTIRYTDDGEEDTNARVAVVDANDINKFEGMEFYTLALPEVKDEERVIVEVDLYNAANSYLNGEVMDEIWISLVQNDYSHIDGSNIQGVKIGADKINVKGHPGKTGLPIENIVADHNAEIKTWNKLILDFKRESYLDADSNEQWHVTTTATYGGKTYTNHTYTGKGNNFNNLVFTMNYNFGGRFYLDNLRVYKLKDVDNAYATRWSENFDDKNYEIGATPEGFAFSDTYKDTPQYTTFTTQEKIGKNQSKVGKLYNKAYTSNESNLYDENGELIEDQVKVTTANDNTEFFTISVPGLEASSSDYVGMVKKTRLSFKYYLPKTSITEKGSNMDALRVGLMVNRLNNNLHSSRILKIDTLAINYATVFGYSNTEGKNTTVSLYHKSGEKTWVPVVIEVESVCGTAKTTETAANFDRRYEHTVKYSIGNASQTMVLDQGSYDINRLLIGISPTYGGTVYLDDFKAETGVTAADFANLDTAKATVFEKSVAVDNQTDAYSVKSATFADDAQSISLVKLPGAADSIHVITALYNGNVLEDAAVNTVDTTGFAPFEEVSAPLSTDFVSVKAGEGYSYKVFVFNSEEGLKPLADMFIQ